MDGPGKGRGLSRSAGPAADIELGDHQSARIRERARRRSRCCPIFIPWWTSFTSLTTSARWASWTCTFWRSCLAATKPSRDLTPAWNGGIYWAGQRLRRNRRRKEHTKSLALFYLSVVEECRFGGGLCESFTRNNWAQILGAEAGSVAAQTSGAASLPEGESEQVFSTDEGPVVITTRGKLVFVAESFPLDLARKLTGLILDAQGARNQSGLTSFCSGSAGNAAPVGRAGALLL
jgi:hypothetical protein